MAGDRERFSEEIGDVVKTADEEDTKVLGGLGLGSNAVAYPLISKSAGRPCRQQCR